MPSIKTASVKASIVNAVNPRLMSYTNATIIAICVLVANIATVFGLAAYLDSKCSTVTTVDQSSPVVFGSNSNQLNFIQDATGVNSDPPRGPGVEGESPSEDGLVTTTRKTNICVMSTRLLITRDMESRNGVPRSEARCENRSPVPKCWYPEENGQVYTDYAYKTALQYQGCVAEWMQCHPSYPFDSEAAITRRNQPCINPMTRLTLTTTITGVPGNWPAVGWCGSDSLPHVPDTAAAEGRRNAYQTCFNGPTHGTGKNSRGEVDHGCMVNPFQNHSAKENLDVGPAKENLHDWEAYLCGRRPGERYAVHGLPLDFGSPKSTHPDDTQENFRLNREVPYEVTYHLEDHRSIKTCKGYLVNFTIAFGFAAQIELVATLIFLAVFTALGVTKRKDSGSIISSAVGPSESSNYQAMEELQKRLKARDDDG